MEEKPSDQPSNASPGPGRGWNDPPLLPPANGMSPSTGAIKKSGRTLNKRVAFPLSGSANQSPNKAPLNLAAPSLMPPTVALPPKAIDAEGASAENSEQDESLDLSATLSNFEQVLESTSKFGGKATVHAELESIKSMWEKEQLNDDVCLAIQRLSKALLVKDTKSAQDSLSTISKSLVARHDTVEWSSALRSLVNHFALASVYGEPTDN
ncbi:Hypothetical predicted protein [Cloeon dipterum]|uniref:SRA1/Sec31 domain-containing protein n=1 Tax=Cloeon dipterum TaxID=197152 RepID=A0A8S1CI08_9INSE|nr:Hypothetical predicted protein [Cloeon dipterum]